MAKDNYQSKVYSFLVRTNRIDPQETGYESFVNQMSNQNYLNQIYNVLKEEQKSGRLGTLKGYNEFSTEFGTTTPTTATETEVVAEEETPQQGTPARTFPTPQQLKQPVTNQQLPNVGVQPQTNQPQSTPEETQIAPIDQQAGQVHGGRPISGDVLANAPKQEFQWSGQAPTKPVVQPQIEMPQTPEQGMQEGGINPADLALSTLGSFETSLIGGIGSELKGISELGYSLDKKIVSALEGTPLEGGYAMLSKPEDSWIYQAGQGLQNFAEENLYRNPQYQGGVLDIVGQGLGSVASIMASGGLNPAGGVVKLGTKAMTNPQLIAYGAKQLFSRPSISGALMMVGQETEEARKLHRYANSVPKDEYVFNRVSLGESEEDASKAYDKLKSVSEDEVASGMIPFALFSGATEAIPLERLFSRLGKASKDIVISALKNGGVQGVEEAVQEVIQQTISNVGKGDVYNEAQRLSEGLVESAEGGGATGFVLGSLLTALAGKRANIAKAVADGTMTKEEAIAELSDINKAQTLVNDKLQALDNKLLLTEGGSRIAGLLPERTETKPADKKAIPMGGASLPSSGKTIVTPSPYEVANLPEAQDFFEKNSPSETNIINSMPASVENTLDKIAEGDIAVSAESLHEAYKWINESFKQVVSNQTLSNAEKGATLNLLSNMLSDIDKGNTYLQETEAMLSEGMDAGKFLPEQKGKPLPQGQAPKGTATPSISQAKAIREENRRKQAGTTTLPSSGETIIAPAPATTEVATEAVVETPIRTDLDAKKADIEKAQKQLDNVESRINPNANHPLFNVGQKYDDRYKLDVRDFKEERKDKSKDGVEVITKIYKPATVDKNGKMTSRAEVEVTRFDSIEQANEFVNAQYNKYKTIAKEKLAKANAGGVGGTNPALADVESTAKATDLDSKAEINNSVSVGELDSSYTIKPISKDNPMYKLGYRYEARFDFPESLGENGNYSDGNYYKEIPTKREVISDITKTLNYELEQLNSQEYLSGRDEAIKQKLEEVNAKQKQQTPTQDAVQKQTASQVPVQSGTTSSQEVAKGEPQAEPQSTADKGQAQATATQEEVGTTPAEVASSEIANISDKTSVRDLASMQEGEVSAGVFSELNKGDKITIRGNEYVVTTKTKGTKKTEFKNKKGEDRYYTKSTITLKKVNKDGSLGSPISGTLVEYSNRGSRFVGGNAWQNLSRDIEGDITVDLINENNKFHEPSQSFKLAQQYVDKINAEVEKQQATAQTTPTAEANIAPELIGKTGEKIAELQSRGAMIDNYNKQIEAYEKNPTDATKNKILDLEKKLGYTTSYFELSTTTTTTTEVTLNTPNETTIKDIEKIENATEKGRELALSKPVNKWVKRAFDNFQDLSSRAKKAGIYDGTTLKIGGKEYTVDTPAKFKAFLAQSQANFDAINEAVKDIPSEQKTDTNPSPKTVEEKSKEVFNDAKSTFVFPIGLNPKFKFDSRLPENVVRFFKKYFRPRGLWTKGMFSEKRRMENQISAQVQKSEFLVRDLRNAVKEAYPKGVTQEQLQAMNDVLQGMPREIPANLYAPLTKMREHIDELSQMMISEGIIDEKLVPVFDANMGIYTTRTYAIHNDPKSWLNYIDNEPEGQQIRNNAVNFLRQATEAKADRLDKFADENEKRAEKLFRRSELAEGDEALMLQAKADEVIARADKQRELARTMREQDFDAQIEAFLFAEGQPLDVVRKGNVGAKDLGVLKKRKNIPDAIRALMGEEKDPLTNYTMSVAKMSALIANNQFLNEVKAQGVTDGLFTKTPQGKNTVQIASASTDSMSPLNGLYTTKDIAEAFKEFDANTKSPWYIDAMLWLDAAIKVNKTVLSQGTHIRNFISNPIIELANGYIPTLKGKAIDSQMEQILNRRFGDKEKLREYIIKLTELGVLGQGGNYREILSVYEDLKGNKYDYQKLIEPKITGAAKKSWNIAQKVYKGGDEFWKVVAFENERAVLEKAYGDTKTSEELDQMAADIIRKTRVDYSMVPKAVKAINKIPFTGTFVTFPAEVLRIGFNIPAVAYEEMNSGNKVLREHGIKRMAGYLTAMTLPYGVKELAKYLLGMDDEEEEARKKFLAPWAQNSTLIWIGKDRYIDTGFSDAFSILKKPIVAFSRGESAAEGALNATKEFLGPAISEGLGYKVSKNVLDNTDEFGNPIYDENADIGTIYTQVSTYVLKQVEPGTVSQARRLYLGETGALSEKGQQYRTGDEVLNAVFGIKPVTINWDNAVSYKFRDAVESINNSNKIFLKESKELRKDDKEGRRKAAESTNLAVENAYNDLREYYTSALKIGMIPQKVDDIMKQSGVPKELAYAVKNNTGYKNYIIVLNDGTVIDRNTQRFLRER